MNDKSKCWVDKEDNEFRYETFEFVPIQIYSLYSGYASIIAKDGKIVRMLWLEDQSRDVGFCKFEIPIGKRIALKTRHRKSGCFREILEIRVLKEVNKKDEKV